MQRINIVNVVVVLEGFLDEEYPTDDMIVEWNKTFEKLDEMFVQLGILDETVEVTKCQDTYTIYLTEDLSFAEAIQINDDLATEFDVCGFNYDADPNGDEASLTLKVRIEE